MLDLHGLLLSVPQGPELVGRYDNREHSQPAVTGPLRRNVESTQPLKPSYNKEKPGEGGRGEGGCGRGSIHSSRQVLVPQRTLRAHSRSAAGERAVFRLIAGRTSTAEGQPRFACTPAERRCVVLGQEKTDSADPVLTALELSQRSFGASGQQRQVVHEKGRSQSSDENSTCSQRLATSRCSGWFQR